MGIYFNENVKQNPIRGNFTQKVIFRKSQKM